MESGFWECGISGKWEFRRSGNLGKWDFGKVGIGKVEFWEIGILRKRENGIESGICGKWDFR